MPDPTPITSPNRNEDPLTHESGAHPVATGVGAAGGGAAGAAVGLAIGGPVGGLIGAMIGAVAGGLSGSAVGEAVDPTANTGLIPGDSQAAQDRAISDEVPSGVQDSRPDHGWTETALPSEALPVEGAFANHEAAAHEEIAIRAWGHYQAEGYPEGRALDHWLRAEGELRG